MLLVERSVDGPQSNDCVCYKQVLKVQYTLASSASIVRTMLIGIAQVTRLCARLHKV